MNTLQDRSMTPTTARKTRGRATRTLGAAALGTAFAMAAGLGLAGEKANGQVRSDSAYFTVYSYHCAPTFFEHVAKAQPDGMEVAVLESRFRVDFDGDCRAFYLSEIAPRIESAQSDLAAVNR
jgi:hypothetical protein